MNQFFYLDNDDFFPNGGEIVRICIELIPLYPNERKFFVERKMKCGNKRASVNAFNVHRLLSSDARKSEFSDGLSEYEQKCLTRKIGIAVHMAYCARATASLGYEQNHSFQIETRMLQESTSKTCRLLAWHIVKMC